MSPSAWAVLVACLVVGACGQPFFCCFNAMNVGPQSDYYSYPTPDNLNVITSCAPDGCYQNFMGSNQYLVGFAMVDSCDACTFSWNETATGDIREPAEDDILVNPLPPPVCCTTVNDLPGNKLAVWNTHAGNAGCSPLSSCFDTTASSYQVGICYFVQFQANNASCYAPRQTNNEADAAGSESEGALVPAVSDDYSTPSTSDPDGAQHYCCYYQGQYTTYNVFSTNGCNFADAIAQVPNDACYDNTTQRSFCTLSGFHQTNATSAVGCLTSPDCSQFDGDCLGCTLSSSCRGYCYANGKCFRGSNYEGCYNTSDFFYTANQCIQEFCPRLPSFPTLSERCQYCTSAGCGLCGTSVQNSFCMPVVQYNSDTVGQPNDNKCPAALWHASSDQCPGSQCPKYNNCSACASDPTCQACVSGDGSMGACAALPDKGRPTNCPWQTTPATLGQCEDDAPCSAIQTCTLCSASPSCVWCPDKNSCHSPSMAALICNPTLGTTGQPCYSALLAPPLPPSSSHVEDVVIALIIMASAIVACGCISAVVTSRQRARLLAERQALIASGEDDPYRSTA